MKKGFFYALLFCSFLNSSVTFAGTETGNGGDGYAAEFILMGKKAVEILKAISLKEVEGVNVLHLSGVILSTEVHSRDALYLNGQEVDAINYPNKQLIELNRSRWEKIRNEDQTIARYTLVIHEYLYLMQINDSQYQVSQKLIQAMSPSKFSTNGWWAPMNPVNYLEMYMDNVGGSTCSMSNIDFNLNKNEETKLATYTCGLHQRNIKITKSFGKGGNGDIVGTYHRFYIEVLDENNSILGNVYYEPSWGNCIIFSGRSCQQSGDIGVGDVKFKFIQNKY
jgi:hypothetical protein